MPNLTQALYTNRFWFLKKVTLEYFLEAWNKRSEENFHFMAVSNEKIKA